MSAERKYVLLHAEPYEGMWSEWTGEDSDPLPTFATRDEANAYADKKGYPKDEREVLAVVAEVRA